MSAPTVDRVQAQARRDVTLLRGVLEGEAAIGRRLKRQRDSVGVALRDARLSLGLGVADAAMMAGCTTRTIRNLERGSHWSPTIAHLLSAAYAERCR
ncbi:MAG TPA: helix-turn-helix domain-containing protein [Gemmatimonadaceae bacterium]|nr:helix-turn-helix domain-containing protein [Gemmatimonadaceae bacterium]